MKRQFFYSMTVSAVITSISVSEYSDKLEISVLIALIVMVFYISRIIKNNTNNVEEYIYQIFLGVVVGNCIVTRLWSVIVNS